MTAPILSAGTHIVVGDGRKALILVNDGTAEHPSLTVETVLNQPDPPSRELGSDRPGRVYASIGARRSATEETDWHQLAEDRFAHEIVAGLVRLAERERLKKLVLVAPPRTMAELRKALPEAFSALITAEITKDLTKHPIAAITAVLQAEQRTA